MDTATASADTVKHRKARVGREGFDARAMSPAKAIRLALGKAADAEMDLVLSVSTIEQRDVVPSALRGLFPEDDLLLLLEGEAGRRGAVRMDMAFLMSLIEHQTTGRVADKAPDARRVTRTDAAMVAPLLDAVLIAAGDSLGDQPDGKAWCGFRYGAMLEDVHNLVLALDAEAFHLMRLAVELGDGARSGLLDVLVPHRPRPAPKSSEKDGGRAGNDGVLGQLALEAPVTLQASLGRIDLTLDAALALSVGDVLPVSGASGLGVRLEGAGGHLVTRARLGQMNGLRALRLSGDRDADDSARQDAPDATPRARISGSQPRQPRAIDMKPASEPHPEPGTAASPEQVTDLASATLDTAAMALSAAPVSGDPVPDSSEQLLRASLPEPAE